MITPPLPQGFSAAGVSCGIKSDPGKLDLSLFVSTSRCAAAGVFTQNRVVGAPVKVSRARVPGSSTRAVIINSGNANACTGDQGVEDARWMTATVARLADCEPDDVLVCSTGVIGRFLPREKLAAGIPAAYGQLSADADAFQAAARGMMTTDTFPKQAHRTVWLEGKEVAVSGVCKGAAMIAPNMATMLGLVLTDAALVPEEADALLRHGVDRSFNCISVDGHMSTSDTVLLLANGASGARPRTDEERQLLQEAIDEVCMDLAQSIIRDAEGASHFITIDVSGLATRDEAHRLARAIADSALVKTAVTGNDPNWGRIVSAAGYAGVPFAEHEASLWLNGVALYQAGTPVVHDAAGVSRSMADGPVHIDLRFTRGGEAVRFWTSDLTAEYVRLNAEYTT